MSPFCAVTVVMGVPCCAARRAASAAFSVASWLLHISNAIMASSTRAIATIHPHIRRRLCGGGGSWSSGGRVAVETEAGLSVVTDEVSEGRSDDRACGLGGLNRLVESLGMKFRITPVFSSMLQGL